MSRLPLEGVRVIDMASLLAGPTAAMFLADHGADVIKLEMPGRGDEMRYWGSHKDGVGLYSKMVSRGKRSVTADFRTPLGVEIVKRLARTADVLLENYRPGTMERWGLGYDVLSAINPGIVMLRVTGWGQEGPYAARPGFGTVAEAFAGGVHISGYPDRPPLLPAFGLADTSTGLMGAYLVMVALKAREANGGRGQVIDLPVYETVFTLMGPQVVYYDQLGEVQERTGNRFPFTQPRGNFQTRDGKWVTLSGSAQSIFERLCRGLGVPELIDDPRFADNRARMVHADALEAALAEAIARFDRDDLLARLQSSQAAIAPVNSVADVVADPHVQARGSVVAIEDGELGGPVRMQNVVGRLSDTPGRIRHAGPPVGAHNREVLVGELGFSEAELEAAGIALAPPRPSRDAAE